MVLYFDTETTSVCPGQICQLAYVLKGSDTVRKNFYFAVKRMGAAARNVTGLTVPLLKKLSGGRVFFDAADEIHEDFKSADLIVAHNFRFDYAFLQAEFGRLNRLFEYRDELCTMRYFTKLLKLPCSRPNVYKYPKLSELISAFSVTDKEIALGCGGESFHDARFDAEGMFLAAQRARKQFPQLDELLLKSGDLS